jgi:hypothetical protein
VPIDVKASSRLPMLSKVPSFSNRGCQHTPLAKMNIASDNAALRSARPTSAQVIGQPMSPSFGQTVVSESVL